MTTTINNATAVGENPHFAHGTGIEGLCHNLQAYPQEWAGAIFTNAYNPQRLDAIASQASNVKMQALMGVRTVGAMLAVAAQSGELDNIERRLSRAISWRCSRVYGYIGGQCSARP